MFHYLLARLVFLIGTRTSDGRILRDFVLASEILRKDLPLHRQLTTMYAYEQDVTTNSKALHLCLLSVGSKQACAPSL